MKTNLLKNEQGRSMVEMLGVLAVIGVLSVAGIAGYSIAMQSYRTNEVINAASMLYVLAAAQNAGNGATGTVGYDSVGITKPSGVSALSYSNQSITITFNDTKDCTAAANKLGDKADATNCATTKTLTVNFGEESGNSGIDENDPSTAEYYFCADGKITYQDYQANYVIVASCQCKREQPPEYYHSLAAAKAALCN